jgi:acyl-CoA reductase-like NAD-dependent aldehyde dehydrogenase
MELQPSTKRPRIIVHSLAHAEAALAAAAALGVPVMLASAPAAAGYAGPLWFKALIDEAKRAHPAADVAALLDCGEEPGMVLGALRAGIRHIRFTGGDAMRRRLAEIAAQLDATIEGGDAPPALDLRDARDPAGACHVFLAGNESRG